MIKRERIFAQSQNDVLNFLIGVCRDLSKQLGNNENLAEVTDETICIPIVGISGLGKSRIFDTLCEIFPDLEAGKGKEIYSVMIAGKLVIFAQVTPDSSFMSDISLGNLNSMDYINKYIAKNFISTGNDKMPETILYIQKTFSQEEAAEYMQRMPIDERENALIKTNQTFYNELTLGVPKLLKICKDFETKEEVAEVTASYLARYFQNVSDGKMQYALSFFCQTFLSEGRSIPLLVLQKLKDYLDLLKLGGVFAGRVRSYAGRSDAHSRTIYGALSDMNETTKEYYVQNPDLLGRERKIFEIEAWFDFESIDKEKIQELLGKIDSDQTNLDFSDPSFGVLGTLLSLFKLQRSRDGLNATSSFGGGAVKSKFAFLIPFGGEKRVISNYPEENWGGYTISPDNNAVLAAFLTQQPNIFITFTDHGIAGPAEAACSMEAVLQKLGIRYRITRPDSKVYTFDSKTRAYERFMTQEDLAKERWQKKQDKKKKKR